MTDTRYFTLNDEYGKAPAFIVDPKTGLEIPNERAGEPDPIQQLAVQVPYPTQVEINGKTEIVETTRTVTIEQGGKLDELVRARVIPGSRTVETDHPAVASLLLESGQYREDDKPPSERARRPRSRTRTKRVAAKAPAAEPAPTPPSDTPAEGKE